MVQYFKNALHGKGRVFAANSTLTYSLLQADDYAITPAIYDEGYIDFLLEYCKKNKIHAIISLFDIDLPMLSKNRALFETMGVKVLVSGEQAVDICNDKWKTYQFLLSCKLEQPNTYISITNCKDALKAGKISFPLIIKPRWGMGSIGIYQADTEDELDIFYKKLRKEIFDTYLKFESKQDEDACVLVQQKVSGAEVGLDILNDLSGKYVTTIAKKKMAMRAGETDVAQIIDSSMFRHTSKIVSQALKHIGNLDVDCFVEHTGKIYLLEMNCRFGGHYPFSHLAGVDFPRQIIRWLNHCPTDEKLITPQIGLIACKEIVPVVLSR